MHIASKTLKNGFSLPVYGIGLWKVGGGQKPDTSRDAQEISCIQRAIEMGITHIDTAEAYGHGHAEELLGKAMKGYDRSSLIVTSKILPEHQSYDMVRHSLEASLERLGTDYIDLYLLHQYPQPGTPVSETMRALDQLVAEGLIKHIGASNMTIRRFQEAQRHSKNKLVCNQVYYNLQYREAAARGIVDFCQQNDVMLVAYRPIDKGALAESALLDTLAQKYNRTKIQIYLNWLISQENVVTICKTSSIEHLEENLGALGWSLDLGDMEQLQRAIPSRDPQPGMGPLDYNADIAP